ncbi:unnamed protein product [Psylliodes chrysocephalus]|uniref:Rho-GAP domain-containing protein n=1 Tax=Psylliodes chrysocephalus TaxID=3402493 RepID=A0A9P0CZU0_9CUCU|nr:unnamed protein product [Psylliodes chrysocephala]
MTVPFSKSCKCTYFFDNFQTKSLITSNVVSYLTDMGLVPVTYSYKSTQVDATTSYEKPKKKPTKVELINKGDITLELIPKKVTTLRTGQTMKVPTRIHYLCTFILRNAEVKDIFKKPGSAAKQEDIKALLNKGEPLSQDASAVDVAQIILQFLKELPVAVIPECQHAFFLSCYDHADREDVLTLACLLLPPNHVNLLAYLMQFFEQVTTHHKKNHVTLLALGPCIGPVIMPMNAPEDIKKVADIMVILMKRADLIGMVPELMTLEPKPQKKKCSWVESLLKRA